MMNRKRVETEIYTAVAITFGSHEVQPAFISQLELAISVARSLSLYIVYRIEKYILIFIYHKLATIAGLIPGLCNFWVNLQAAANCQSGHCGKQIDRQGEGEGGRQIDRQKVCCPLGNYARCGRCGGGRGMCL